MARKHHKRIRGGVSRAAGVTILVHVLGIFRSSSFGFSVTARSPLDDAAEAGAVLPDEAKHRRTLTFEPIFGEGEVAPAEPAALFSQEWAREYSTGEEGCDLARGSFMWRGQGFGSNMNSEI